MSFLKLHSYPFLLISSTNIISFGTLNHRQPKICLQNINKIIARKLPHRIKKKFIRISSLYTTLHYTHKSVTLQTKPFQTTLLLLYLYKLQQELSLSLSIDIVMIYKRWNVRKATPFSFIHHSFLLNIFFSFLRSFSLLFSFLSRL